MVLASVRTALKKSGLNRVTTVGHSLGNIQTHSFEFPFSQLLLLGAALALLDAVFLPLFLPGIDVNMIGYGVPRVH